MYVIKHKKTGKYLKFGSYSSFKQKDHPYEVNLYTKKEDAQRRIDRGFDYADVKTFRKIPWNTYMKVVKIEFTYKEI